MKSKQEEFLLLGYDNVSEEDIWEFLLKKKWRQKEQKEIRLFEMVQHILSLKVGEFMNYMVVEALKEAEFTFENEEERCRIIKIVLHLNKRRITYKFILFLSLTIMKLTP